jgi:DNA-binding transcriptional MerR regulator
VDDANGYRWYAADRLPQARLIARLRSVGLPLDAVAECLKSGGDPDVVDRVLHEHRQRLDSRLTRLRGDLHRLTHLMDDGPGDDTESEAPSDLPRAPSRGRAPGGR